MRNQLKARTETVFPLTFDRRIWTGPTPSNFIVYGLDVGHLVLAPGPIREYEKTALFKEKARATLKNGQYMVEFPRKVYEFYHLDEADYTVMASQTKPRTVEILL